MLIGLVKAGIGNVLQLPVVKKLAGSNTSPSTIKTTYTSLTVTITAFANSSYRDKDGGGQNFAREGSIRYDTKSQRRDDVNIKPWSGLTGSSPLVHPLFLATSVDALFQGVTGTAISLEDFMNC